MGWDSGTSTQRTYRYIRISLVAVVLLLGVSLLQQLATYGPLGSISASFYTPEPEVTNGMVALLVVGSLVWILVVVLSRSEAQASKPRMRVGIGVAALLLLTAATSFFLFPSAFFASAHYVATGIFFLLIAAVALVSALEVRGDSPGKRKFWLPYLLAAMGMIVGILIVPLSFLLARSPDTPPFPWVFWGEAVALSFFAVFWILQTVEKWKDINPLRLA